MTKTRQEPLPGEVNAGRSVKRPPLGRWWGTGGAKKLEPIFRNHSVVQAAKHAALSVD